MIGHDMFSYRCIGRYIVVIVYFMTFKYTKFKILILHQRVVTPIYKNLFFRISKSLNLYKIIVQFVNIYDIDIHIYL